MPVELKGDVDVLRLLQKMPDKVAYASAAAVNEVTDLTQKDTVNNLLPSEFTLRSKGAQWWQPGNMFGFNRTFASKDDPSAELGTRADWMGLHETGGTKTASSGGNIAIGIDARETPTSVLSAADKPRRLLDSGKAFKIPTSKGDGIFEREKDGNLKLLYLIKPGAQIKPDLHFVEKEGAFASAAFNPIFNQTWAEEMATLR